VDHKTNNQVCGYGHDIWGNSIKSCHWERANKYMLASPNALDISRSVYIQINGSDMLWASQFWLKGELNGVYTARTYGEANWQGWCMSTEYHDWFTVDYYNDGYSPRSKFNTPAKRCFWTLRFDADGSVWGYQHHVHQDWRRLEKEWSVEDLDALPESDWELLGETFEETELHRHGATPSLEDGDPAVESAVAEVVAGAESLEDGDSRAMLAPLRETLEEPAVVVTSLASWPPPKRTWNFGSFCLFSRRIT